MKAQEWKEILKTMKLKYIEKKSPGFFKLSGGMKMKLNPYTDQTSAGLTNCIADFLKFNNVYCNRINTTGTPRMIDGKLKFTNSPTRKGTADLDSIFPGGIAVKIEVKCGATNDRLSKEQLAEKQRIEAVGGHYVIATDFPSFLRWYQQFTGKEVIINE